MSINEADLPTSRRSYGVTVSYPDSHYVRQSSAGAVTYVTGPQGPPGPEGKWTSMTQAEFDALPSPDPATLYIIIG
jgi:hypothetical protein